MPLSIPLLNNRLGAVSLGKAAEENALIDRREELYTALL
jgi:hypothetical protein